MTNNQETSTKQIPSLNCPIPKTRWADRFGIRIWLLVIATKMGSRTRLCEEFPRPLAEGTTWQSGGRGFVKSRPRRNIFIPLCARRKRPWPIVWSLYLASWLLPFTQKMTTQSRRDGTITDGTAHGEPVEPSSGGVGVLSFSFSCGWRARHENCFEFATSAEMLAK